LTRAILILCLSLAACGNDPDPDIKGDAIPTPLTQEIPNPERGKALFAARGDAHCILCHVHETVDAPFQGDLGPDLTQIHNRLSKGQIRLRIVDYDRLAPDTTMPSYYRTHDLQQVAADKNGQTILTALEIEDIIAFLTRDATD